MQISRFWLVICVIICALQVRGDNQAQIKAREALDKKLNETQPQPEKAQAGKTQRKTPKTSEPIPSQAATTGTVAAPVPDSAAIAKAREEMRKKMQDAIAHAPALVAEPETATPTQPAPAPAPVPAVPAPAPAVVPATPAQPFAPTAAAGDPQAINKAREAVRQKMQEVIAQHPDLATQPVPAAPPATAPATAVPAPVPSQPAAPTPTPALAPAPSPAVTAAPADSDALNKAREAMRQKMQEGIVKNPSLATQPAPAAPPATAPATAVPAPVPSQPAAPIPAPAPAAVPEVTAAPADSGALDKAREAMRQKMQEVIVKNPNLVAPPAPAAPSGVAPAPVTPAPAPVAPAAPEPALAISPAADPAAISKARDAVREKMEGLPAPAEASMAMTPNRDAASEVKARREAEKAAQDEAIAKGKNRKQGRFFATKLRFPPLEAPASPLSADKQQRLHELLQRYKADEITPEQYQAERAKIIGAQ